MAVAVMMMHWLLFAYLFFSLLGMVLASWLVPVITRKDYGLAIVLFAGLCLTLPIAGSLLAVAYALALRSVEHRAQEADIEPILLPSPARDFRLRFSTAAPGAIAARLRGSKDPQQRVEALSLVMGSRFFDQYQMLRSALRDEFEEVRLLAYAALDQREQENTEMLLELQQRIQNHPGKQAPRFREYLAWLRWNMEHSRSREIADPQTGLLEAKLADVSEERSASLEPEPPLLLGLRALEAGRAKEALQFFAKAQDIGVDAAILAPHQAAAHYLCRDLRALREIYHRHPELSISSRYGLSYAFWQLRDA